MKTTTSKPEIEIEVTRGDNVESRHLGSAVLVDASGAVHSCWGNRELRVFPRSAVKPLQAMVFVGSGAVDAYGLADEEIAMSCASHGGETRHLKVIRNWMKQLDITVNDLECGPHWPLHEDSAQMLARVTSQPENVHNNCSGKHLGFITMARHLGIEQRGYINPEHSVQIHVRELMETICETQLENAPRAMDGCSVPTWAIPLKNLALGFAKFGTGQRLENSLRELAKRSREAMLAHPFLVAGTGRFCTRVMSRFGKQVICKTGAEGVYCAAFPELGLGLALKCHDGARRASEMMLGGVMQHLGLLNDSQDMDFVHSALTNHNGYTIGELRSIVP